MNSSNHYPRWKSVLSSPVTIVILLVMSFFLVKAVWNVREKSKIINQKMDNASSEYSKLVTREGVLKDKVDFLATDAGIESELRAKYKAVAEGEKVAVILEDKVDASSTIATTTQNRSWWRKLLGFVGL